MTQNLLDIYADYLIRQNHKAAARALSHLLDDQIISRGKTTRFLNCN